MVLPSPVFVDVSVVVVPCASALVVIVRTQVIVMYVVRPVKV